MEKKENTKGSVQRARYKKYLRDYYMTLVECEKRGRKVKPAPDTIGTFLFQLDTLLEKKSLMPLPAGTEDIPKLQRKRA